MVLFVASLVGLIEALIYIHQKYSIPDHFINYFTITRELILSIILLNVLCFALFLIMLLKNINKVVSVPQSNDTGGTRFEIEKLENLKNKL